MRVAAQVVAGYSPYGRMDRWGHGARAHGGRGRIRRPLVSDKATMTADSVIGDDTPTVAPLIQFEHDQQVRRASGLFKARSLAAPILANSVLLEFLQRGRVPLSGNVDGISRSGFVREA